MEQFLAGIERRALVMAELATHDRDEALDLVQDAMMAFVGRYGSRPAPEWPPLFHRILQNRIRDWHRRRQGRGRWWGRLGRLDEEGDDRDVDPIQQAADPHGLAPDEALTSEQSLSRVLEAMSQLPLRQQQAFLLRVWEGLDVAETARAMDCSGGSVKTHLSRALRSLRERLQE